MMPVPHYCLVQPTGLNSTSNSVNRGMQCFPNFLIAIRSWRYIYDSNRQAHIYTHAHKDKFVLCTILFCFITLRTDSHYLLQCFHDSLRGRNQFKKLWYVSALHHPSPEAINEHWRVCVGPMEVPLEQSVALKQKVSAVHNLDLVV